MKTMIQVVFLS